MTICYFGIFDPEYVRNRILCKGLLVNGVAVKLCTTRKRGWRKYPELLKLHRQVGDYDVMLVGFPGPTVMPLAWWLAHRRGKRIVFDSYNSQYHALVDIRKQASRGSLKARVMYLRERLACRLAEVVLMDTQAHCQYMAQLYRLPLEKFKRLFVGSDLRDYLGKKPLPQKPDGKILCHFHGGYSPFQGVDVILRAAKRLEDKPIYFNLIGAGQEHSRILAYAHDLGVTNVSFVAPQDYATLASYHAIADICLGVFGKTETGLRPVIPNKVQEGLAAGKPVVTGHLPAMDELLTDGDNVVFCTPGDDADLAAKILGLAEDSARRERLGKAALTLYESRLTPRGIGKDLFDILNGLAASSKTSIAARGEALKQ